jgi:hypothetical protein
MTRMVTVREPVLPVVHPTPARLRFTGTVADAAAPDVEAAAAATPAGQGPGRRWCLAVWFSSPSRSCAMAAMAVMHIRGTTQNQ